MVNPVGKVSDGAELCQPILRLVANSAEKLPVNSLQFRRKMAWVGSLLRRCGVKAVVLADGIFGSVDAYAHLAAAVARLPQADQLLRRLRNRFNSGQLPVVCCYGEGFRLAFEQGISAGHASPVHVYKLDWSCETHCLAHAEGALRLIAMLAELGLSRHDRVLLWGHGQAGSVFALAGRLLAADPDWLEQFFAAAAPYYKMPFVGIVDAPLWQQVKEMLTSHLRRKLLFALDVVTFGCPEEVFWGNYPGKRLHVVNRPWQLGVNRNVEGRYYSGDLIQKFGYLTRRPGLWAARAAWADCRLQRFLYWDQMQQVTPGDPRLTPVSVYIQYATADSDPIENFAGHGVYTDLDWLAFHAELVASQLYGAAACADAA